MFFMLMLLNLLHVIGVGSVFANLDVVIIDVDVDAVVVAGWLKPIREPVWDSMRLSDLQ